MRNTQRANSIVAVVLLQLCAAWVGAAITENFCDTALCGKQVHVACNPVAGLQGTCPAGNATQVSLQGSLQQQILDLHNRYRSQLASGKLPNYKSASKMLQMVSEPIEPGRLIDNQR